MAWVDMPLSCNQHAGHSHTALVVYSCAVDAVNEQVIGFDKYELQGWELALQSWESVCHSYVAVQNLLSLHKPRIQCITTVASGNIVIMLNVLSHQNMNQRHELKAHKLQKAAESF